MSTKEKLVERFKRIPSDFTFDELVRLFGLYGFEIDNKGKTSGSRVRFKKGNMYYTCHKPHPENVVKKATLSDILAYLTLKGLL
ncbi:MAG: type II toxin-antitoxin system HicA family toxin [Bacteroidales bacterium]|nr:type II toxin-antitoxin system HicA family toxin [Bacteroidales bacterium]